METTPESKDTQEKILSIPIEEEMKSSYLDYALSVIIGRALPDIRDGLKPVHRRILYSMSSMGMFHNKPFKKCARIVGECFVKDTMVLTQNGLVPIQNIERGDFVQTTNGLKPVTELYVMPKKELLRLTLKNGISNTVTRSQKFKIINENFEFEWKEAKDLKKGDYLVIKADYPDIKETVKIKVAKNLFIELNENIAYLLGQFLSDGWIEKSSGRICFYSTSKEIIERINNILMEEFNYAPTIELKEYDYETTNGNILTNKAYQIRINSRPICNILSKAFNLTSKTAYTKEIPSHIFKSPKKVIFSLISGMIDGDGSIHKSRNVINYSSVSEKMIDSLLLLTQQLGILGMKYEQKSKAHALGKKIIRGKHPSFSIEFIGTHAQELSRNLDLAEKRKRERCEKLLASPTKRLNFNIIPFAGKHIFNEFSEKHLGGGEFRDENGNKFRKGIKYKTGTKIRYSKDLKQKHLRRDQVLEFGIFEKLKKINSKHYSLLKKIKDENLFFIEVNSIESAPSEKTYDIQVAGEHEFIANGVVSHNCLGKYHPHGDTAVFDALVRMAQDFSLRYPLIEGQGNFGSIDGDRAAAMRYVEARLNKIAEELLSDIDKDTVDFQDNFDGSLKEPTVLPARIPNLLINGSSGIAVGMATNIPPHNLNEISKASIALLENPSLPDEELFSMVPAPDFPTAGTIVGKNGILRAYKTGHGRYILRGKLEEEKGKLVITEIPYQVNKSELIKEIANCVNDKKIEGIRDIRDESSRGKIRVVLELKKDANPELIKNKLFSYTRLQISNGIALLGILNNEPKYFSLRDLILHFLEHRKTVVLRRTKYNLKKAEEKHHILEGLVIALNDIDNAIAIIKKASSVKEAKESLIQKYSLSEIQSQAILDMKLQKLTSLEQEKIKSDLEALTKTIADLKDILAREERVKSIIKDELLEVMSKYGDGRKTSVMEAEEDIVFEDLIKEEEVVITVTNSGYAKRIPLEEYRAQARGGKGVKGVSTKNDEDFVQNLIIVNSHDYLLFFTNKGRLYWKKAYTIPEASRYSRGKALINLLSLQEGEYVTSILSVKDLSSQGYITFFTKNGLVKKTPLSAYSKPRNSGIIAIYLEEKDELRNVLLTTGEDTLLVATREGKAVKFSEKDVRPTGRTSRGVRAVTLSSPTDFVIKGAIAKENEYLFTITENGYGKRSRISDYRLINRGGKGVINIICSERNGKVASIETVSDEDIMIVSKNGVIIRIPSSSISLIGRNTQGVRIMRLVNDKVIKTAKVKNGESS